MFNTLKLKFCLAMMVLGIGGLKAQELSQRVFGQMKDDASEYPLPGVVVVLQNTDTLYSTVTDADGNYFFQSIYRGIQCA